MALNLGSGFPLAAGTVVRATLNTILTAIVNKFSGGIDNSDINADADIVPTKLSASNQEWVCQLDYYFGTQGAWPAVSATTPLAAVALPGQDGDASWVVTDVCLVCSDVGDGAGLLDVRYGHYVAGVWTNVGTITASLGINGTGVDGTGTVERDSRLSVTIPNSTDPYAIALMSAGQGTGVVTAGFLSVSVRLRRILQSI